MFGCLAIHCLAAEPNQEGVGGPKKKGRIPGTTLVAEKSINENNASLKNKYSTSKLVNIKKWEVVRVVVLVFTIMMTKSGLMLRIVEGIPSHRILRVSFPIFNTSIAQLS